MTIPIIVDHLAQALDKLIQRYKGKPRFAAWLGTFLRQVQDLEDAAHAVDDSRDLDTADDARLEIIARLVQQQRRGAATEQFRRYIKARIKANRSDGSPEALKGVAQTVLNQGTYLDVYPSWETVEARGAMAPADDPIVVSELLYDAHTAGIGHRFIGQFEANGFLLGDDTVGGTVDSAHGLSSEALTSGGYLAGIW